MQVSLNKPQMQFLQMRHKFRGFVSGYRGGKTYVGSVARIDHFLRNPKINQGYFAPTYPQIRDIFYPTIEEVSHAMGVRCDIKTGNKEVHIYNGGKFIGTIICRSMQDPSSIIGFKIGDALCDELDTMSLDKAQAAWNKIIARMSYKGSTIRNGVDVTTTPEGFKFVYEKFFKNPTESYGLIHASTYDNEANLPDDYISSLIETYPEELIEAYLNGQFVNLTSGTVYRNYSKKTCGTDAIIQKGETLLIGQDFNVNNMASVVYVRREGVWLGVDELTGLADTPALMGVVGDRYQGHNIIFYPDSSGKNTSSKSASVSDISIINEKYATRYRSTNPLVKDRVLAVNMAFTKGLLKINEEKCPETVKCLEQQAYDKNGVPDKSTGVDHQVDALGYPIAYEMPINRPAINTTLRMGGMY